MNWMRRKEQSIERAIDFASMVLPTPGTSSMSRCPSAMSATSASLISACLPRTTRSTLVSISWNRAANRVQSWERSSTSTSTSDTDGVPRGNPLIVRHMPWKAAA